VLNLNYLEVTVKTTEEIYESVANLFWEMGAGGVVIEDPRVFLKNIEENNWDTWEMPENVLEVEKIIIKGYFAIDAKLVETMALFKKNVEEIKHHFLDGKIEITETEIAAENWSTSWMKYYKPEKIGNRVVVKPTWEEYLSQQGDVIVELDPGMAFGTGNHPTTAMCIRALEEYVYPGCHVLDVGTGSGILAVVAAKLGAGKVIAIDRDPVSIDVSRENIAINNVSDKVTLIQGDLAGTLNEKFDVIVSNIIADVIIKLVPQAAQITKCNSLFISSGIIKERLEEVIDALENSMFVIEKTLEEGEWVTVIARRC
jgi:ribosomal protein L11 methyltransferase